MKRFTAWRRRPWAGYAVVLAALAAIGVVYAGFSPSTDRAEASNSAAAAQDLANGRELFNQNCASCHGLNAEGTKDAKGKPIAPSLIGVGAASVDFQVSTGRMPAMNPGAQMPRKEPVEVFQNPKNVEDVAAYIQSLGGGPTIPGPEQVDPAKGDAALGGKLFRTNCAQCHNFAGSGGALTNGKSAPSLMGVQPKHIYEAMETGPENMPVFGERTLTPDEKLAIIKYIKAIEEEPNPGGAGLGRIGPVSEGLIIWLLGIGLCIVAAMWITAKKKTD
ncbi:MAG: cytochrome bc1 complex diheme cytochrome c subunit [Actinomadura sp.]